jgi:hypothetical protein
MKMVAVNLRGRSRWVKSMTDTGMGLNFALLERDRVLINKVDVRMLHR